MFGLKKKMQIDEPIAHKLFFSTAPEVLSKSFSKYGIVCEDDGDAIWLYATNNSFKKIFCAIYIGPSGCILGKETYIVHNAFHKTVGIYFENNFQAVINFQKKKCISKTNQCSGSTHWGKDVMLVWNNDFVECINKW